MPCPLQIAFRSPFPSAVPATVPAARHTDLRGAGAAAPRPVGIGSCPVQKAVGFFCLTLKHPQPHLPPLREFPTMSELNREPPTPRALPLGVGVLLHSPVVMAGSQACAQMASPEGSFSSLCLPPGLSFRLGKPDALELITHDSWKHRMSELERKRLTINNGYQHLVNTYLVPGPFPGITSFKLPSDSRRQAPSPPCFTEKGTETAGRL